MIVNKLENSWEIIFQRNHALLAGQIAMALHKDLRPPFWSDTLLAIMDHDDGQNDFGSGEHITDEGHPKSFREYDFHLEQAERVVKIASHKSKWVQLLVSMHAYSLRKDVDNKSAELKKFLKAQLQQQYRLRQFYDLSEDKAEDYYSIMRWCDQLSLILCERTLGPMNNEVCIGSLPNLEKINVQLLDGGTLTVNKWCFDQASFSVVAERYHLQQNRFRDEEHLREALKETDPVLHSWQFKDSSWISV